jgi:galactonate dehydratase
MSDRIERIETACVAPRWGLLRVLDGDGVEGFGEFTVEGQLVASEACVRGLSEWFIGQPAGEIRRLVRGAYDQSFYHGGAHFMSALGGIETALWDIAGKRAGVPVHSLLGGRVRDKVKVYRWAGGNNNAAEAAAEEAARVVAEGAKALKMNACPPMAAIDSYGGIRMAVARARAVRDAIGDQVDIAFDFHGRTNVPMARVLAKELEFARPMFYEEPVRPDHNRWLPEIAAVTHVPIATGERMCTVAEFADVVAAKGIHVLQPDLVHVGGILNTLEVANLAENSGIAVAPHCPLSPIAFMASVQVVAASRAGWIMEWSKGIHYNASGATGEVDPWLRYLDERDWPMFEVDENGHLDVPDTPGLGIRVNWGEVLKAAKTPVEWRDQRMELPDGTRANW